MRINRMDLKDFFGQVDASRANSRSGRSICYDLLTHKERIYDQREIDEAREHDIGFVKA